MIHQNPILKEGLCLRSGGFPFAQLVGSRFTIFISPGRWVRVVCGLCGRA